MHFLRIVFITIVSASVGTGYGTRWLYRRQDNRNRDNRNNNNSPGNLYNQFGFNFQPLQPFQGFQGFPSLLPPSNIFQSPFLYQTSQFFQPPVGVNFPVSTATPPFLWNFNQQNTVHDFEVTNQVTAVPLVETVQPLQPVETIEPIESIEPIATIEPISTQPPVVVTDSQESQPLHPDAEIIIQPRPEPEPKPEPQPVVTVTVPRDEFPVDTSQPIGCGPVTGALPKDVPTNPFQRPCISVSDFVLDLSSMGGAGMGILNSNEEKPVEIAFQDPPPNSLIKPTASSVSDLTLEWSKENFANQAATTEQPLDPDIEEKLESFQRLTETKLSSLTEESITEISSEKPGVDTQTQSSTTQSSAEVTNGILTDQTTIDTGLRSDESVTVTTAQPDSVTNEIPTIYHRLGNRPVSNRSLIHMPRRIQVQHPTKRSSNIKRPLDRRERIIKIAAVSNAKPMSSKMRKLPSEGDSKVMNKEMIYRTNERRPKITLPTKKITVSTRRVNGLQMVSMSSRPRLSMRRKLDDSTKVTTSTLNPIVSPTEKVSNQEE